MLEIRPLSPGQAPSEKNWILVGRLAQGGYRVTACLDDDSDVTFDPFPATASAMEALALAQREAEKRGLAVIYTRDI